MSETAKDLAPIVTYPRDAVVRIQHVQAALGNISREKVEALDLPCVWSGRDQLFPWGLCLDELNRRAMKDQPTPLRRKAG